MNPGPAVKCLPHRSDHIFAIYSLLNLAGRRWQPLQDLANGPLLLCREASSHWPTHLLGSSIFWVAKLRLFACEGAGRGSLPLPPPVHFPKKRYGTRLNPKTVLAKAAFRDDVGNKNNSSSPRNELVESQPTTRPRYEGMYTCKFCPYSCRSLSHVTRHERTHTGEKPFRCSVCEKAFAFIADLRMHMRTHTGEKPFRCEVCQKAFAKSHQLLIHKRVHTGEKPYRCGTCEKEFSHKSSLLCHETSHSGERPYKCDACGNTYIRRCDFDSHRKRVHK
ncbi:gastrula zinc finger protein XlCGF17.1-like [Ixodes scapularis]|uniref:gastrula zinc finger protein XlCGF17.1-like n=1 Tax=Ixodes scapularis TaxID=6945 RepID=UPI001A9EAB57|nr:gastrula zinc finger protein XlCGF17.1-like [Ixodes scapularis]